MDFEKTLNCKPQKLFMEMDASLVASRTSIPYNSSNLRNLTIKTRHTNAYVSLECIRKAYKYKVEKWKKLKNYKVKLNLELKNKYTPWLT